MIDKKSTEMFVYEKSRDFMNEVITLEEVAKVIDFTGKNKDFLSETPANIFARNIISSGNLNSLSKLINSGYKITPHQSFYKGSFLGHIPPNMVKNKLFLEKLLTYDDSPSLHLFIMQQLVKDSPYLDLTRFINWKSLIKHEKLAVAERFNNLLHPNVVNYWGSYDSKLGIKTIESNKSDFSLLAKKMLNFEVEKNFREYPIFMCTLITMFPESIVQFKKAEVYNLKNILKKSLKINGKSSKLNELYNDTLSILLEGNIKYNLKKEVNSKGSGGKKLKI